MLKKIGRILILVIAVLVIVLSVGGIVGAMLTGVFAVKEMGRFYRHVLVEKRFPHHTAVAFAPVGKTLWAAMRMLGVEDIGFNRPAGMLYPTENPF